jgi:alkylhydroperoxidase/carboxymuconolactone decarboxylase family protein YurZ
MNTTELCLKYGDAAIEAGNALQPSTFARRLSQRDRLDQHYTKLWLDFQIVGMGQRTVLDVRTRSLVQVGQFTLSRSEVLLEESVRSAIAADVAAREILEIILQCTIYGGQVVVEPAIEIFERVALELGLEEELQLSQLPLEGTAEDRSLEEERENWHPEDAADPRLGELMDRHGWHGVSRGMLLRPEHHLSVLAFQDALDTGWASLFENFAYAGMYTRGIVDDKTRLLCMVGNLVSIGEQRNTAAHIRGSIRAGASPREVMEVILQTAPNFGMPRANAALRLLQRIMQEDGLLDEIGNPADPNKKVS